MSFYYRSFHVCASNGVNAKDSSKQSLKPKPERLLSEAPSVNTPGKVAWILIHKFCKLVYPS